MSYSRITNEERGINIERYEDLLPVSFKEVEWTRSSRVHIQENESRVRLVEKYEKELEKEDNHIKKYEE